MSASLTTIKITAGKEIHNGKYRVRIFSNIRILYADSIRVEWVLSIGTKYCVIFDYNSYSIVGVWFKISG